MVSAHVPDWLVAWKWAPLIAALGLGTSMGPFSLSAAFLVIPVGVHLGLRYGRAGLAVIAVAGLPLVLEASVGAFRSTSAVGVYAVAVLLAWWLSQPRENPLLPRLRLAPWVYAALLLLPLQLGLGAIDVDWLEVLGAKHVRLVLDGYPVFFLLVFTLGVSRARTAPLTLFLALLAVIGTGLEYLHLPDSAADLFRADRADLPPLGLVELRPLFVHYRFDSPAQWLTALAWFGFGRFLGRAWVEGGNGLPAPAVRAGQFAVLAFLALGGYLNAWFLGAYGNGLIWAGSYHALVLTAVVAGLYFKFAGVVALCLLITGFAFVDALVRAALYDMSGFPFTVNLGDYLIAYGFGALGVLIRSEMVQEPANVWSGPWVRFLVFYLLLVVALVPLDTPASPLLVLTVFCAGIAAAMALSAARDRLTAGTITLHGGWLSLATVLMLFYLAYSFAAGSWETLLRGCSQAIALGTQLLVAAEVLDEEEALALGFLVPAFLLLLWTFGTTVEKLAETAGQFRADVRALLHRRRERVPVVIRLEQDREEAVGPRTVRGPVSRSLRWINRSLLAAAVAAPVCLLTYNTWLEYRERLARDREDRVSGLADGASAGAVLSSLPALDRDRAEREVQRSRDRFTDVLIQAAEAQLADFPGVTVQRSRFEASVRTAWRPDPADPAVRRRVAVTIQPAIGYDEMPVEQAVRRSLWVRTYRQDRGLLGLWLEGARDAPIPDDSLAADLEQAIETTASTTLRGERDDRRR